MSNTINVSVPADDIDALDAARAFFERVHSNRSALPGYPEREPLVDPADKLDTANLHGQEHTADEPGGAELEDDVTGATLRPDDPQPPEPPTGDGFATDQINEDIDKISGGESDTADDAVELDKDGLPWDGRIHASTKKKTQDGRWKKKRGVDDETRQQVEAELRQLMDAPAPAEPTPSEPSGATPPPPPVNPESVDNSEGEPSGAAPPPPPAAEPSDMDFPTFLEHVGEAVADERISWEQVNELCSEVTDGAVTKSALLSARTDLIPSVWARISQELNGDG